MYYLIDDCMDIIFVEFFCGLVLLVDNGYIVNSIGVYGGDKVIYFCKNGYFII